MTFYEGKTFFFSIKCLSFQKQAICIKKQFLAKRDKESQKIGTKWVFILQFDFLLP
jgi:hypothetical protein